MQRIGIIIIIIQLIGKNMHFYRMFQVQTTLKHDFFQAFPSQLGWTPPVRSNCPVGDNKRSRMPRLFVYEKRLYEPFGFPFFKALWHFSEGGGWQFYFHDISVDYLVGGFLATPLKNIGQNRSGSSSPIFGWKIKEMFELPPPSHCWWFRNPAGTSWGWSSFPSFTGNSYIPAGAGFLPSTVLIPLVSVNKALWNFSGGGALRWGGWLGWLISHKKKLKKYL